MEMSDLIDRNRLKERLFPGLLELSRGTSKTAIALYMQGWNDAITSIIENEPSAETKKGRWIVEHGVFMHDGIYGDMYHCSVCGYRERNPEGFNYCPNCGAKMPEIPTDSESEDKE
jgi:hypothetical protein